MEIIPSILTNSPEEALALLSLCENVSERAHIDIIDPGYAQNETITPEVFENEVYLTKLDYHLMVPDPVKWVSRCSRGNAERIIGQVELMEDQVDFCQKVLSEGCDPGLAIDLDTEVNALETDALALASVVLVMSVQAGFGGQVFDARALTKIEELVKLREENGYHYVICDDGGVTSGMQDKIKTAGADEVSIGRRIFEGDLRENIDHFKKALMR